MAKNSQVKLQKNKNKNGDTRGMHPNSQKNLKPGANKNGRPRKELSLTNCAREKLREKCPYAPNQTWLEYLVERWLGQAAENATYFNQLIERLEGKVTQPIGGEGGGPIPITVIEKEKDHGTSSS